MAKKREGAVEPTAAPDPVTSPPVQAEVDFGTTRTCDEEEKTTTTSDNNTNEHEDLSFVRVDHESSPRSSSASSSSSEIASSTLGDPLVEMPPTELALLFMERRNPSVHYCDSGEPDGVGWFSADSCQDRQRNSNNK